MSTYRRSAFGIEVQLHQFFGLTPEEIPFSTLNEKFGVEASSTLTQGEVPSCRYLVVGNDAYSSTQGIVLPFNRHHRSDDPALFSLLPLVIRPVTNDIKNTYRQRFALRYVQEFDGQNCFVYAARRFDPATSVTFNRNRRRVVNGNTTTTPFVPDSSRMSPIPEDLSSTSVNELENEYIQVSANVLVDFDEFDATELLNAARIMYGDENAAVISEIGFVTGVDRMVNVSDGSSNTFPFNEVVQARIANFSTALRMVSSARQGFSLTGSLVGNEPVYKRSTTSP